MTGDGAAREGGARATGATLFFGKLNGGFHVTGSVYCRRKDVTCARAVWRTRHAGMWAPSLLRLRPVTPAKERMPPRLTDLYFVLHVFLARLLSLDRIFFLSVVMKSLSRWTIPWALYCSLFIFVPWALYCSMLREDIAFCFGPINLFGKQLQPEKGLSFARNCIVYFYFIWLFFSFIFFLLKFIWSAVS